MKQSLPAAEPLVFECDVPQSAALVWRALTERELLAAWLAPNDIRPEVGARFSFERAVDGESRDSSGTAQRGTTQRRESIDCEVLEVEPNKTLRWRQTEQGDATSGWRAVTSVVTVELTDNIDGGTHLRLIHGDFAIVATARVVVFPRPVAKARRGTGPVCQLRWAA